MLPAAEIQTKLDEFHGGPRQRFILKGILLSEGVAYLEEAAECNWLVVDIATAVRMNHPNVSFQVWTLTKNTDGSAKLLGQDGNYGFLGERNYAFSNFPLPKIVIWAEHDEFGHTLLLPHEH